VWAFLLGLLGFRQRHYGVARDRSTCLAGDQDQDVARGVANMAYHPEIQHAVGADDARLRADRPHLDRVARSGRRRRSCAAWPAKIVGAKHHAVEACWQIVDTRWRCRRCWDVPGKSAERLFRDGAAAVSIRPTPFLVHEIVARRAGHRSRRAARWDSNQIKG